uniref:Potassium channel tetramerisation-type BTB domain-containing protein n=1 Tax=Globisporangium ultimum (strain ATCC 200006 / CBS 805.95 / DAOM BR144) TaxID=431595 RepID=K3WIT1_GLOUD
MFTERSVDAMMCDDDGYDVEEMQCGNEDNADVEGVLDDHYQWEYEQETNGSDLMNENQRIVCDMKQHQDKQHAAFVSLVIPTSEAPSPFTQPIASSGPSETTIVMVPTEIHASNAVCKSFNATSSQSPELRRIITFDVGGRLFRCKESLIRKYPTKRLNQIITCGCEQIHGDAFFIDRNPQHFEIVLDWYRTGTYVQHPLVNQAALKEDAKYFDVYDDFFPQHDGSKTSNSVPPVPPRPQRRLLPQATMSKPSFDSSSNVSASEESPPRSTAIHQSYPEQPATQVKTVHKSSKDENVIARFSKTELRKIVWNGAPVVYMVRSHEQLVVASVIGHGKLHVRVCDATGVQAVHVDRAVLFDSQSYFYLQGARAKLQHCLLPGGFTYTFWMELVPDSAWEADECCGRRQH